MKFRAPRIQESVLQSLIEPCRSIQTQRRNIGTLHQGLSLRQPLWVHRMVHRFWENWERGRPWYPKHAHCQTQPGNIYVLVPKKGTKAGSFAKSEELLKMGMRVMLSPPFWTDSQKNSEDNGHQGEASKNRWQPRTHSLTQMFLVSMSDISHRRLAIAPEKRWGKLSAFPELSYATRGTMRTPTVNDIGQ